MDEWNMDVWKGVADDLLTSKEKFWFSLKADFGVVRLVCRSTKSLKIPIKNLNEISPFLIRVNRLFQVIRSHRTHIDLNDILKLLAWKSFRSIRITDSLRTDWPELS